jgi:amino acid transporter
MPTLLPSISVGTTTSSIRTQAKLGPLSCISLIVNKIIGTGIFSNPSIIFQYTGGNVGLFLSLFVVGGIIIFCGLIIYLEFALNLPFKNGGEKNYLLRVFNQPKGLMGCVYAFSIVLLGFLSGNSFAFGKYVLYAVVDHQEGDQTNDSLVKVIGVTCISFCIFLHIKFPNQGTRLFNFLGVFKLLILVLIIAIGGLVSLGVIDIEPTDNFTDVWLFYGDKLPDTYSVAVGLLEVIYSFKGWENVNYVLNEIEDPYHVLTIAAPSAVLLTTVLYFFVLISYLIVIPKKELLESGVLVAGIFFNKIFGESITSRLLPIFISLSNLGNVLVVSYAHSVVNQELAMNNYLPFSSVFQYLPYSLLLHWFVTVFILVAPPLTEIYEFVVNLYIYPGTWINVFLTLGLIYLKLNKKKEKWDKFNPIIQERNLQEDDENSLHSYTEEHLPQGSLTNNGLDYEELVAEYNPRKRNNQEEDSHLLISRSSLPPPPANQKTISAPFICVFIFWFANLFLALMPFVRPPHADQLDIPYWCFPTVGTLVFILGAIFYYARPYVLMWVGSIDKKEEVKYEEEFLD